MMTLDEITQKILEQINDGKFEQSGAFNLRHNGISICHGDSEHVKIKKKEDKQGIDIFIDGTTKGETVNIPVVVDASAVVMGNIKSRSVQINNGAVIEGFCSQCYADVDVQGLFGAN